MPELIKMDDVSISNQQLQQVKSVNDMKLAAIEIEVHDQIQYEIAADYIGDITSRIAELDAMRKKLKAPILEAGKNIDDMFRGPLENGRLAKKLIQTKMLDYVAVVEYEKELAEKAAAKAADEVKQKAEEEALALIANGDDDAAQQILDAADLQPGPINIIESPKAEGISTRANWKAKLLDLRTLVAAIADGKAPISLVMLDTSAANKYAKALRNTMKVPGLDFYNDATLAVRKK